MSRVGKFTISLNSDIYTVWYYVGYAKGILNIV